MEDIHPDNIENLPVSTQPHPRPLPLVRVSGSHREIGRQIGEDRAGTGTA